MLIEKEKPPNENTVKDLNAVTVLISLIQLKGEIFKRINQPLKCYPWFKLSSEMSWFMSAQYGKLFQGYQISELLARLCYGFITIGGFNLTINDFTRENCYQKIWDMLEPDGDKNAFHRTITIFNITQLRFPMLARHFMPFLDWCRKRNLRMKEKKAITRYKNSVLITDKFKAFLS